MKVFPDMLKGMKRNAAVLIQRYTRGHMIKKALWNDIINFRMQNIFEHFGKMKNELETEPIALIISYWRKFVIKRKA